MSNQKLEDFVKDLANRGKRHKNRHLIALTDLHWVKRELFEILDRAEDLAKELTVDDGV